MKARVVAVVLIALFSVVGFSPSVAEAADSVSVPGQVGVDQCPVGYQHATGISVNVSTHEYTTICYAPPTAEDLLLRAQDEDFRARIDAATKVAEEQSRAWNSANPGMQKCVQWGPIVHANGVGTAAGGVCANPVAPSASGGTPSAPADSVSAGAPAMQPRELTATTAAYSVKIPGQNGVENCPVGYQGANGLIVDVSTGQVVTECWKTEAWKAWVLGGDVWQQYQSSGGAYDVEAELDRRAKVDQLKARALSVARAAADVTPGITRCSAWSGYNESGQECAYTFIRPGSNSAETVTSTAGATATTGTPVGGQLSAPISEIQALITNNVDTPVEAASISKLFTQFKSLPTQTKSTTFKLPISAGLLQSAKSLTPKVCAVVATKVTAKKSGSCNIKFTVLDSKGNSFTTTKTVKFLPRLKG